MKPEDTIIVALDTQDFDQATRWVEQLRPFVAGFKVGLEMQMAILAQLLSGETPAAITKLLQIRPLFREIGDKLFFDGKWCDISNTVEGATKALRPLRANYLNVHAVAGKEAVKLAVAAKGDGKVLGVTVLTSISSDECVSIFRRRPKTQVLRFARTLAVAKADGIICSPQELMILSRESELDLMERIIPGIRPLWAVAGDQKRVMTPAKAIQAGATALVIGRPITKPPEGIGTPVDAVKLILEEVAAVS